MLDTTSINFGISKFKELIGVCTPLATQLSESYIRFTVWYQVTCTIFTIIGLLIVCLLCIPVWKYGRNKGEAYDNFDEPGFVITSLLLGFAVLVLTIGSMIDIQKSVMALSFPEMFTIKQIIEAGGK